MAHTKTVFGGPPTSGGHAVTRDAERPQVVGQAAEGRRSPRGDRRRPADGGPARGEEAFRRERRRRSRRPSRRPAHRRRADRIREVPAAPRPSARLRGGAVPLPRELRDRSRPAPGQGSRVAVRVLGPELALGGHAPSRAGRAGDGPRAADPADHRSRATAAPRSSCCPYGARAWYVKADKATRSYRALLGWTLPSGQFRALAESNLVTTPRVGPSPDAVYRRLPYTAPMAEIRAALGADAAANPGPWSTEPFDAEAPLGGRKRRGGASDAFRPTWPCRRGSNVERRSDVSPGLPRPAPSGERFHHARGLLVPGAARPPAVRPPSRVPGVPRGGLVLRGPDRDVRADRATCWTGCSPTAWTTG